MAERTRGGGRGTTRRTGGTSRRTTTSGSRTGTRRRTAAVDLVRDRAGDVTHPERSVVTEPPPAPDYPRYRVEPGARMRLADVDPDESEHYGRKKDVADELNRPRSRTRSTSARPPTPPGTWSQPISGYGIDVATS